MFVLCVDAQFNLCVCVCLYVLLPSVNGGEGDVPESIRRIEKLLDTNIEFHELDLLDKPGLENVFKKVRESVDFLKFIVLNTCKWTSSLVDETISLIDTTVIFGSNIIQYSDFRDCVSFFLFKQRMSPLATIHSQKIHYIEHG